MKQYVITKEEEGRRLFQFLKKLLPKAPKGLLYKCLRKKNILLNGLKSDGHEFLKAGDQVSIFFSNDTISAFSSDSVPPCSSPLPSLAHWILYEDAHIILVNKPAGLLTQRDKSKAPSLNDALLSYTGIERTISPSVCNRLDRNTSGIVICGKTAVGLKTINELIRKRRLKKYYLTIVYGSAPEEGALTGFLSKNQAENQVSVTDEQFPGSHPVKTSYKKRKGLLLADAPCSLLSVRLITGRSHQIRVHMASMGHPILGDRKYGTPDSIALSETLSMPFQLLHAWKLVFPPYIPELPELSGKIFTAEPPWDDLLHK